jgi:hypothetical protein
MSCDKYGKIQGLTHHQYNNHNNKRKVVKEKPTEKAEMLQ